MGVYIEGLDRPRGEYMRIHIDFDGEVWVFRGSEWKSLGIKATNLDLVRCGECKHKPIKHDPEGDDFGFNLVSPNGYDNLCPCLNTDDGFYSYMPEDKFFCAFGERRADEHNT